MKGFSRWLVAGWVLCGAMAWGQGNESRFFRIKSLEPIDLLGISDGIITWDHPEGIEVTVEVTEDLADPSGWRRYTGIAGDESRGSVRVFDQETPRGMVFIPRGTNAGRYEWWELDPEYPDWGTYSLTAEAFYMDATPVTKAQWDEVYTWATHADRGENVYSFDNAGLGKATNHPVHTVNWYDCVKWCNARSERDGRTPVYSVPGQTVYRTGRPVSHTNVVQMISNNGYRLPTLEEHEYASRGGPIGKRFPWGNTINHSNANYRARAGYYDTNPDTTATYHPTYAIGGTPYTSPVGSFSANGYGLYDMAGNVWEWCWDIRGTERAYRGGSWFDGAALNLHVSSFLSPNNTYYHFGFRALCR